MRILVLGVGLQGRATLHDLSRSPEVMHIIAADTGIDRLGPFMKHLDPNKVELRNVDASDANAVAEQMRRVDAVVSLLPVSFHPTTARLAVDCGIHYVNTSYAPPSLLHWGRKRHSAV